LEGAASVGTFAASPVKAVDFLSLYKSDSLVQNLAEGIRASASKPIRVKGLAGSLDSVLLASVYKSVRSSHLVIMQDKEEAAYFFNDLQNLLGNKEVFLFPMSYKRPYEYDETEVVLSFISIVLGLS